MTAETGIEQSVARAMEWLERDALPQWMDRGYDATLGLFHERLDYEGRPIGMLPHRLMVQCRQLYVLCHLTLRGVVDERRRIERTWQQIEAHYRRADLQHRWVFSIDGAGEVVDEKCDTYSLTFVLLALAWLYRLWPSSRWLQLADEIFALIDGPLAAQHGCAIDGLPRPDQYLRQNPNMHLMEACLALYEAAARPQDLSRAGAIRAALSSQMIWPAHQALPEVHDDGWHPEGIADNWFEPGHHFEWVWLLRRYERYADGDVEADIQMLLARSLAEGVDSSSLVVERVGIQTGDVQPSRRSWGTCEYLKACAAQAEAAPQERNLWARRANDALTALQSTFLATATPGLWRDRISRFGAPLSIDVPASSFYHFALAMLECERVFGCVALAPSSPVRRRAVFFDRDGVLNVDTGYPVRPQDICFMDGAFEAVRLAREAGFAAVVVSNQSAVCRGYATEADILHLHRWMSEQFAAAGAPIDGWYHCPYHSQGAPSVYLRQDHHDRKPNPGMLKRAALDLNIDLSASLMIGDKTSDLEAGARAGTQSHLFDGSDIRQLVASLVREATLIEPAYHAAYK